MKQSLYNTGKIKIEYRRKEQEQNGKLGRRDDGRGGILPEEELKRGAKKTIPRAVEIFARNYIKA